MTPQERRKLARDLSKLANATFEQALAIDSPFSETCPVVGITGPPGAGKSTLIGRLAQHRVGTSGLAIVAIDPSSPVSGGAILGDRIRMAELADDPRIYIRSLATRASHDGLADNLPMIIDRIARDSFGEILLETTGVGQVEYAIRAMAGTMVLVMTPGAGDQIQAMKSGIIEIPDLFVVNKSDLAGADQTARDIRAVLLHRKPVEGRWTPPVIMTSTTDDSGLAALSQAIDQHREWLKGARPPSRSGTWRRHLIGSLVARRVQEILGQLDNQQLSRSLPELVAALAADLAMPAKTGTRASNPVE